MSKGKTSREATKKQNVASKGKGEKFGSYQGVKKTTGRRKSFGGSYTSGNKRLSAKTRSRKGGKKVI